jgi:hypothetical protein
MSDLQKKEDVRLSTWLPISEELMPPGLGLDRGLDKR